MNLISLLGLRKNIKNVTKPHQTIAFAKFKTAAKHTIKLMDAHNNMLGYLDKTNAPADVKIIARKASPIIYRPGAYVPEAYTKSEFKSYISSHIYEIKQTQNAKKQRIFKAMQEKKEQARAMLYKKHEDSVSKILLMDPNIYAKTSIKEEMEKLTDPDICMELLDYKDITLLKEEMPKYFVNTNNVILNQISKGGKSSKRADILFNRLRQQLNSGKIDSSETKQITSAILQIGEDSQVKALYNLINSYVQQTSKFNFELIQQFLKGITKAAKFTKIPEEFAEISEIVLRNHSDNIIVITAAETLSHFKGKFDVLANLLSNKNEKIADLTRNEFIITSGFRSALKDNKLEEYKKIVLDPDNKYLRFLIDNYGVRTSEEEKYFKHLITKHLLHEKYKPLLHNLDRDRLYKIFRIDTK